MKRKDLQPLQPVFSEMLSPGFFSLTGSDKRAHREDAAGTDSNAE